MFMINFSDKKIKITKKCFFHLKPQQHFLFDCNKNAGLNCHGLVKVISLIVHY